MSIVDAPTSVGEDLTAESVRAAVLRGFIDDGLLPDDDAGRRLFVLGALSFRVAHFLNAHPEHRDELLPDPDDAGVTW